MLEIRLKSSKKGGIKLPEIPQSSKYRKGSILKYSISKNPLRQVMKQLTLGYTVENIRQKVHGKVMEDRPKMLRKWTREYYQHSIDNLNKFEQEKEGQNAPRPDDMPAFRYEIADGGDPRKIKNLEFLNLEKIQGIELPKNMNTGERVQRKEDLFRRIEEIDKNLEEPKKSENEKNEKVKKLARDYIEDNYKLKDIQSAKDTRKKQVAKLLLRYLIKRINLRRYSLINPPQDLIDYSSAYHLDDVRQAFFHAKSGNAKALRVVLRKDKNYVLVPDSVKK